MKKRDLNNCTLVNIRFDQELFNGLLDLVIDADNFFDKDYEESYGFPRAGRTIYGGIEVRF